MGGEDERFHNFDLKSIHRENQAGLRPYRAETVIAYT
jgi:hypothetical protein